MYCMHAAVHTYKLFCARILFHGLQIVWAQRARSASGSTAMALGPVYCTYSAQCRTRQQQLPPCHQSQ